MSATTAKICKQLSADPFNLTDAKLIKSMYDPHDEINEVDTLIRIGTGLKLVKQRTDMIAKIAASIPSEDKKLLLKTADIWKARAASLNELHQLIRENITERAISE